MIFQHSAENTMSSDLQRLTAHEVREIVDFFSGEFTDPEKRSQVNRPLSGVHIAPEPGKTWADLSGLDLSEMPARYRDFSGSRLEHVWLSGATLKRVSFRGAALADVWFDHATLKRVWFIGATLERVRFHRAVLDDVNFDGATLAGVGFDRAMLNRITFIGAVLRDAWFTGATLNAVWFISATLKWLLFNGPVLNDISFSGATLTEVKFLGATLAEVWFNGATLNDVTFSGATLNEVPNIRQFDAPYSRNGNQMTAWLVDADGRLSEDGTLILTQGCFTGTVAQARDRAQQEYGADAERLALALQTINYVEQEMTGDRHE
jgi:uncharacterized protein YjbI with pentapeptide repeats